MKICITGFDPFGGEKINPAFEAVKLLPDEILGNPILKYEIPTVFHKSIEKVKEILEAEKLKIEEELTSNYERAITMAASSVAELALRMENLAETLEQLAKDT